MVHLPYPDLGRYRHYKGKEYEVLGIGEVITVSEVSKLLYHARYATGETLGRVAVYGTNPYHLQFLDGDAIPGATYVVYQGQYTDPEFGDKPVWVRELSDFLSVVPGKGCPRFQKI